MTDKKKMHDKILSEILNPSIDHTNEMCEYIDALEEENDKLKRQLQKAIFAKKQIEAKNEGKYLDDKKKIFLIH